MPMRVNEDTVHNLAKLIVLGLIVHLFIIGYVFWQSYEGRVHLVESQREGCERIKNDRIANAEGWRIAQAARRASGDIEVAVRYGKLARNLEARSNIDCSVVFPKAEIIP